MSLPNVSSRPRLVPEDGAENPVFSDVGAGDAIQATILFAPALADGEIDAAERVVHGWFASADWGGARPELVDETLTPASLHLAVSGVRSARAALGSLLEALQGAGLPVGRAIFARLRADGDREALVSGMDPAAVTRQVRYENPGDWWRACFDRTAAPPISEDRDALASDDNSLLEVERTTFAERRAVPLHLPAMRICWGLGETQFSETDGRTEDVARVLGSALRARFQVAGDERPAPTPYDRGRRENGAIDRVEAAGRVGYSCALRAEDLREFLHGNVFRYREYELMQAARDVARALDLEPLVCWRRFSGRYVLQLWERGAPVVHAAA